MAKSNFKLNLPGLNELMKSAEMQQHLKEAGAAIAGAAGTEYDHSTYVLNFVAVEHVYPTTKDAAHDNFENNTLIKATGAVGLRMK